ncbi:MAG TPA: NAD(P)/FAD-dependent oxidoreductase [Candidatus Polarisedimenticolia bacterium]|nr:NAD(P)/FAD-dependent oxidoreductase [Candidatus Polarisedimenticolia bacterium]
MTNPPSVAVVGGGPAGAVCARRLAARGARVTLFEVSPSGEKPCGGGVPPAALREFPELADPTLSRRIARTVIVHAPSGRTAEVPLEEGLHLFRRAELDACLRRAAAGEGAQVLQGKVLSAERGKGGEWRLRTDRGTCGGFDLLVAADGVNGAIGRSLAGPYPRQDLTLALYAYAQGVPRTEVVLKFFRGLDGYLWAFPRTDHVSIGICGAWPAASASRLTDDLLRFMEEHYPEAALDPRSVRGYLIPASARPPRGRARPAAASGEGWAVVGDAAGFVDPLTREGIAHAMRSGAAAAAELAGQARLATPPLPSELAWAHRHRRGFFRPEFLEALVRLASSSAAIRGVLADLLSGTQPYGGLRRRLLWAALPCGGQAGFRALAEAGREARGWARRR